MVLTDNFLMIPSATSRRVFNAPISAFSHLVSSAQHATRTPEANIEQGIRKKIELKNDNVANNSTRAIKINLFTGDSFYGKL